MEIKVTKRTDGDGVRYSISGLTFNQIFRIKNAVFDAEEKMKMIAGEWGAVGNHEVEKEFMGYAEDAHDVFLAISGQI